MSHRQGLREEIQILNRALLKHSRANDKLKKELCRRNEELNQLKRINEKYKVIEDFERIKLIISQHIDIYDLEALYLWFKRKSNEKLLIQLFGQKHDNFNQAYDELRKKRNALCHQLPDLSMEL